jgi:hypothetical protein
MSKKRFAAVESCIGMIENQGASWVGLGQRARAELAAAEKLLVVAPANAAQQAQPDIPALCALWISQNAVSCYEGTMLRDFAEWAQEQSGG